MKGSDPLNRMRNIFGEQAGGKCLLTFVGRIVDHWVLTSLLRRNDGFF